MSRNAVQAKNIMVKLIVGAGSATPSPPVGPALGSKGVKAIDFCKEFNARTANLAPNVPCPVTLTVRPDRSFVFDIKSPPTGYLLLRAAGVEKGASNVKSEVAGKVSLKHVYEIAKIKKTDAKHADIPLKSVCKSIIGVAKSMGIKVVP